MNDEDMNKSVDRAGVVSNIVFVVFLIGSFLALFAALPLGKVVFSWLFDTNNHEVLRSYALILAGIFGLIIAIWRGVIADQNHNLDQKKWAMQRFKEGAEMLSNPNIVVQQAGIYYLEKLAETNPEEYAEAVYEILSDLK